MQGDLKSFVVFPWNKNLETGLEEIDTQHMRLIDILNSLTQSLIHDDDNDLSKTFQELVDYTKYHFEAEEAIWGPYFSDDPWLSSHKKTHESFLPRVLKIRENKEDAPLSDVIEEIVKFLIRWLAYHIIDNDKRMAIAVQNMEAGASLESAKRIADEEMSGATRLLINTVLNMYDGLSARTLDLLRERAERYKAETRLREANRRLEEMTIRDQLTGLYNRRHFRTVFQQEISRARREDRYFHFFMFDLDKFKTLNDHYGHLAGDDALRLAAERIREVCRRPGDYVFRLGGEEFGIIIVDQEVEEAQAHAVSICTAVEELGIPNEGCGPEVFLTLSGGGVSVIPGEHDTPDEIMRRADNRLYKAKDLGGNQVVYDD